jgi:hypothetical protein
VCFFPLDSFSVLQDNDRFQYMNQQSYLNGIAAERTPSGGLRWIDLGGSPLSRAATYKAIKLGLFDSVVVQFPGSRRKRRFLDRLSIDRYFEQLMAEQKATKQQAEATAA